MTTCPSRITYPHLKEHFGDEFHVFYLETVCGAPVESGTVCKLCAIKSTTRVQVSRRFDHGLVTGELSPHSHIFGSEWYCKKVATYGTPSQAVVERAMEAQRRARNGIRSVAAKPKLVVRRKASTPSSSTSSSSSVIDQLQTSIIKRTPSQESMAESMDDPIEVQSIVRMKLKATIVEGVHVWLDETTGNVYTRVSGQPRGPLLGIWNEGTFTKCPCV
jgi:hypothetical protein